MRNNNIGSIAKQLDYVGNELVKEGRVAVGFFGGYIRELSKILDEANENEQTRTSRAWSAKEERSQLL